jgi:hypothetical protein
MADHSGMSEHIGKPSELRSIVEQAVSQALQYQLPELQSRIVRQIAQALPLAFAGASSAEDSGHLVQAVSSIHAGSTQKEILRALLDTGSGYCSRIALFVVKAGAASGWQSRGFGNPQEGERVVKDFALELDAGPAAFALRNRVATRGNIREMGTKFSAQFGAPANEQLVVLPLALKEKIAALVYADGGDSGKLDAAALELLVLATSAWLEVISLRKQAAPREEGDAAGFSTSVTSELSAPPVQSVSSFSDPFASHVPMHTPTVSRPAADQPPGTVSSPAVQSGAAAAPAVAADSLSRLSMEDAETHRKAQRFARLLVDEIKLYNQAKVAEGRRSKDLYDRLREDIDKSRASFQKRYGNTVAASAEYFERELVRNLAEEDISVMGQNFGQ